MTRRLAKKVLGHPYAYPPNMRGRAMGVLRRHRRLSPGLSRAARRADRVLRRRYEDDASRWLVAVDETSHLYGGSPPSMYGTPKQGPPPKRATAP